MTDREQGKLRESKVGGHPPDVPAQDLASKSLTKEACTPEAEWQWAYLHRALRDLIRTERR